MHTRSPFLIPARFNALANNETFSNNSLYVTFFEIVGSFDCQIRAVFSPKPFSICLSMQL